MFPVCGSVEAASGRRRTATDDVGLLTGWAAMDSVGQSDGAGVIDGSGSPPGGVSQTALDGLQVVTSWLW